MSADLVFVSSLQQMSAEFSLVIVCVAFVLSKTRPCQQITLLSTDVSKGKHIFVSNCWQICLLSAYVTIFVFSSASVNKIHS